MTREFLVLLFVIAALIYVARKYVLSREDADVSSFGSRLILGFTGLLMGGAGWLFLKATIDDPERYFYSGFVVGPMIMLAGLYALIISVFFPAETVRGAIKHYFRHLD